MKKWLTILTFFPLLVFAQDMTIRNVRVSIPEGILMKVDHSLINTGTLVNHGRLQVGRNWINTGIYNDDAVGSLDLNGSIKQFIVDSRGRIGTLNLSGSEKELITDLHVSHRFAMSGTKISVAQGSGIHLEEGITFEYDAGDRVIGDLYLTGNDLTFPVGTSDRFLPVRIRLPDDDRLTLGLSAQSGKLGPDMESSLAELEDFHWILKYPPEFEGAFAEISFEDAAILNSIEEAVVAESTGPADSVRNAGGIDPTGSPTRGSVVSGRLVRGPYLTLARKSDGDERLPVSVLNLVTPNNDGMNDFLLIENIEAYPNNQVSVFDRWGTKLYEETEYNNVTKRFEGTANHRVKGMLRGGTYFYVVSSENEKLASGFFELVP